MKKATKQEKEDLSRELTAHMEDHVEALVELGWDPAEAQDYAVKAMGDPEVVGRQYDEKLSSFWLWCGTVLRWILIVLVLNLLLPLGVRCVEIYGSLMARWAPDRLYEDTEQEGTLERQALDIRIAQEGRQTHIYRLDLGYEEDTDSYFVCVYTVTYADNPLQNIQVGWPVLEDKYGGSGNPGFNGAHYYILRAAIEKGDESIGLTIHQLGEDIHVEVPVDWEGVP